MHPVLFQLGPLTIHSYGVAIATAFFVAISLAASRAKKEGYDPQKIVDLGFYILIAAIVGSRILYILINIQHYIQNPLDVFKIWEGGLVFYGGLIGAALTAIYYLRKHRLPVWAIGDIAAPSLALGQSIGRWGCFFAGCCYGKSSEVPWSIMFTNENSLAPLHQHLHPTQLYSSLSAFIIFCVLLYVHKIKKFDGQVFWAYLMLYSVARFIIEFFRGDAARGAVMGNMVSTSQFIGIFLFATAAFMFFRKRKAFCRKTHIINSP